MESTKEFPSIPKDFDEFQVTPDPFNISSNKELTIMNHSSNGVLFKVKTNCNKRVKLDDCADILKPGNQTSVPVTKTLDESSTDSLFIIYTLVGEQWLDDKMSAFRCWERVKRQGISTKCITIKMSSK